MRYWRGANIPSLEGGSITCIAEIRYRRGKPESNDVDVVFCPPEEGQDIGLLHDLYLRLSAFNLITHVLRKS